MLRATVRDSADGAPGDLRRATVTFREGSRTLCGPQPATTGAVSCRASLGTGSHRIDIRVGDRYVGAAEGLVRIVRADDAEVDGRGHIVIGTSGGSFPADAGSRMEFELEAERDRGDVEIEFESGDRDYAIEGDDLESFGVDDDRAELRVEADHRDSHGGVVERDATVHVTLTDDRDDAIGVTVWDDDDRLLFSSRWTGSRTVEQVLREGSVRIR
jgi:hypothetical protein